MDWYTLRVISGKEKKIRDSLLFEIDHENLRDEVAEVLVPSENIVEMKNGKKKVRNRVFFPGYLLVNMDMNKEARYLVENVNGVMSFVGPKDSPQPLNDNEIKRIVGSIDGNDTTVHDIEIPFKVGDSVKVIDGPFKDFDGLVQEVNDRNRIKVNVNIFGRPTPIELSFNQIIIDN